MALKNTHMPHAENMYQCLTSMKFDSPPVYFFGVNQLVYVTNNGNFPQLFHPYLYFGYRELCLQLHLHLPLTTFLRINIYVAVLPTLSPSMSCGT